MVTDQQARWMEHYRKLYAAAPEAWLDLSNEAVQAQTFATALEAAGPIEGRRCLDIGCGYGQLSTASMACGHVKGGRRLHCRDDRFLPRAVPHVQWECGSPSDETFVRSLGDFDLISGRSPAVRRLGSRR